MTKEILKQLIASKQGYDVGFGYPGCELIPTENRIEQTEELLGHALPPSYLWFLRNYGGGTIFGDEICHIPDKFIFR